MASNKTITVLTPNGRRQNVKVTPNTTILQILEDVCTKHKLNPSDYDIKHHNKALDTTVSVQFSGLPNNAQLELAAATKIRKESEVILCLQLENGERLMGNFQPNVTLWEMLLQMCPSEEGADNVVIIYMRSEVVGSERLQETTLRSLGITGGRAMVRLIHRSLEELKTQANVSAPLPSKPSEEKPYKRTFIRSEDPIIKKPEPSTFQVPQKSLDRNSNEDIDKKPRIENSKQSTKMDVDENKEKPTPVRMTTSEEEIVFSEDITEELSLIKLGERNALAFTLEMAKSVPHEDLPDEFFDLTVNDAKTLLKDLKRRRAEMDEEPLQTKEYRELEKNKKVLRNLNQYKRSVLRIQFPDRTVLQGTFKPIETVQIVMDFVREYLSNQEMEFHLYTTPPKNILNPENRLVETDCVPCAVLHFGPTVPLPEDGHYLRDDLLSRFSSFSAASLAASKSRSGVNKPKQQEKEDSPMAGTSNEQLTFPSSSGTPRLNRPPPKPASSDKKVPKWFKP